MPIIPHSWLPNLDHPPDRQPSPTTAYALHAILSTCLWAQSKVVYTSHPCKYSQGNSRERKRGSSHISGVTSAFAELNTRRDSISYIHATNNNTGMLLVIVQRETIELQFIITMSYGDESKLLDSEGYLLLSVL